MLQNPILNIPKITLSLPRSHEKINAERTYPETKLTGIYDAQEHLLKAHRTMNDKPYGIHYSFYTNGMMCEKYTLDEKGRKNGQWQKFNQNGEFLSRAYYIHGVQMPTFLNRIFLGNQPTQPSKCAADLEGRIGKKTYALI